MKVLFWLRRPRHALHRARYWWWEKMNPDKPWLSPGTIRFLEHHLSATMRGLEFGSGRSTTWFATRIGRLTSVEHNAEWFDRVSSRLQARGITNVDYRLVPLDHTEAEAEQAPYDPVPSYPGVAAELENASLDLVLVDGHYRNHCIRGVIPKLRPGGYLVVDDVNFWPEGARLPVPEHWPVVDESSNGLKITRTWKVSSESG
jgi:predicted O-methyltransferase YrrM